MLKLNAINLYSTDVVFLVVVYGFQETFLTVCSHCPAPARKKVIKLNLYLFGSN